MGRISGHIHHLEGYLYPGTQYARYGKDFFSAKKVYVNIQLAPLFLKTIAVRSVKVSHGNIFIFRTQSGYNNTEVFKTQKAKDTTQVESPFLVMFKKVELEDVKFSYQDSLKKKSFDFYFSDVESSVMNTDSSGLYALTGAMRFDGLMFNSENGSFLKDKTVNVRFNLEYRPKAKELVIHPSEMEFPNSKLNLSGNFYFSPPGTFMLSVGSEKLDYAEGISLLTQALRGKLEKFAIGKPVKVSTRLHGKFAPGSQPDVDIVFQFSNSKVRAYKIEAEQVTVDGVFSNHVDSARISDDANSRVTLNSFDGIIQGLPTKLTATFRDLKDPIVDLESNITTDLRYLNSRMDTQTVKVLGGSFISHITFSGKLNEYLDSTKTKFLGKLRGRASVKDGAFQYVPRKQNYENIQLSVEFTQDLMTAREISFLLNKSPVMIKGEGGGFIPFFSQPEKKGYVRLNVYSPHFDFASIFSKKSKTKATAMEKAKTKKNISQFKLGAL